MTNWYLGTQGYSYKDWEGVFYPAHSKSREYLAHYSRIFNAVEINTTFYGAPRAGTVKKWARSTPDDFIFCPKTPRNITHDLRLENTFQLMAEFVETLQLFGSKLGPILIQLPPDFTTDELPALNDFLDELPNEARFAVEFRHRSWDNQLTAEILHKRKIAWATTDYIYLSKEVHVTTNFIYIRWLGRHGTFARKDRIQKDVSDKLIWWWQQLRPHQEKVKAVYGFFNDEFAGHAPATVNQFKRIAGMPVKEPDIPKQRQLL